VRCKFSTERKPLRTAYPKKQIHDMTPGCQCAGLLGYTMLTSDLADKVWRNELAELSELRQLEFG